MMASQLSEDLKQFKTIILSLISYATHPKLDTLIEKLTPQLAISKRFLIRMEIKRLAKPCALVVDFRPYFDHCEPLQHQNICHYLDEISKTLFLDGIKRDNGLFSIYSYDDLNEKAKKRHRDLLNNQNLVKAHSKIAIDKIQKINLVNNLFFNEPQVSGKSKCRLFSYDPLGMSNKGKLEVGIEVTVLDINENSCIIKTPLQSKHNTKEMIFLWFYQHDSSLSFEEEIVLEYNIKVYKKTQSGQNNHYLLTLSQASNPSMLTALSDLLASKLHLSTQSQSKHIQPLKASINSKCHEQFLLSNTIDIPMLCAEYQTGWRPSSSLKTPSNLELWKFLSDENGHDPLARLFCNRDLQNAINTPKGFDDYAYILKHIVEGSKQTSTRNKYQFIVIWQSELEYDESAQSLLIKHILNGDYKYIRLRVLPVNAHQDAYIPSALPCYVNPAMALLNRPHNKETSTLLKASNQLAILSDVTELNDVLALPNALAVKEKSHINKHIKCPIKFTLPKLPRKSAMMVVSIDNRDLRREDRFEHELSLALTYCNKQNVNISGVTKNISTRGLLIALDKPIKLKPGSSILLKMNIPYRSKILTVPNQAYLLLSSQDDYNLRLEINGPESKHAACQALHQFIYQNMDDLAHSGYEKDSLYGLQKAMRNIYANNHLSAPFFIHQDKRQWHIGSVAMNQHTKIQHFNDEDITMQHLLLKMTEQEQFRNYCLSLLNRINSENPVEVFYILTLPRKLQQNEQYNFWFSDIRKLQKNGRLTEVFDKIRNLKKPTILRIQLSKPNRIMDKYFRDELHYLEQISSPCAEELRNNMALITGIGEITDHTEQVLQLFDNFIVKPKLAKAS
jgi:hypothetical protein